MLVTLLVLEGRMWLAATDLGQHSHWTFPSLHKVLLDSTVSAACSGRGATILSLLRLAATAAGISPWGQPPSFAVSMLTHPLLIQMLVLSMPER